MSPTSLLPPTPLAQTATALRTGQLDLISYLSELLDRIDAIEPQVQAFIPEPDRRTRLLADAESLLNRYPNPSSRPPLFGIPIGVKDIFHADGFTTQAGCDLPGEELAGDEATSVSMLKAAGALVMGKTVTTEFAYFAPGPTRNPHNLAHTPGGSSSGSAAAVAAGFTPLALGTQTIGSVIRPAAFCGIVGFKPTYNRIPPAGLLAFSRSVDHVGLFSQDVAGMVLAASILCRDWQYVGDLARPLLGIPEGTYLTQASDEALAAFAVQVKTLEGAGYTVIRAPLLSDIADLNKQHRRMIAAEFAEEHATWFSEHESLYRPQTAALIREGQTMDAEEVRTIREGRRTCREEIEHVMDVHGVDMWLCPAALGPAPKGLESTGDPIMNLPWTYAGLPVSTVPAADAANGLPLGLQLVGISMADERLLAWSGELLSVLQDK